MTRRAALHLLLSLLLVGPPTAGWAQGESDGDGVRRVERPGRTGLPLPRFVSLRAVEVNLRTGPGVRYPIDWIYRRKGMPVEVIDEFETWRRIRDFEGTTGWVHHALLDGRRGVLVIGELRLLKRAPERGAPAVARLEPGVIGALRHCQGDWCQVTVEGLSGWLRRDWIYGLYPDEAIP